MSTQNIGFYEDLTKIIFELSSNIIKYAPYFFCCFAVCTYEEWSEGQLNSSKVEIKFMEDQLISNDQIA